MSLVFHVLGLMSGTSLDGLDLCLARFEHDQQEQGMKIQQLGFDTIPMPVELKQKLELNLEPESSRVDQICQLNTELAEWFAVSVEAFLEREQFPIEDLDLIGSHGQTLYHIPPQAEQYGSSLQIGSGSWLAQRTGVTTVSDFRLADMALGGQGAPLVPFLDQMLLKSDQVVALQNIGGMANLTWLSPDGEIMAFDTGPGNVLIDGMAQTLAGKAWDSNGELAAAGKIDEILLGKWLKHPYFTQKPPRSTGREVFGKAFLEQTLADVKERGLSTEDALASITALTARSIAQSYHAWLPSTPTKIYVSGGGAHNASLLKMLAKSMPSTQILSLQEAGWNPDAKEALAFAFFACTSMLGICNNVPDVTGAQRPVIMGQISPGYNWRELLQRIVIL